jgi:hypothetical protein
MCINEIIFLIATHVFLVKVRYFFVKSTIKNRKLKGSNIKVHILIKITTLNRYLNLLLSIVRSIRSRTNEVSVLMLIIIGIALCKTLIAFIKKRSMQTFHFQELAISKQNG